MKNSNKLIMVSLAATSFLMAAESVMAIPAFAKKYEANCTMCHSAWPQLNSTGRKFRELGYRFSADEEVDIRDSFPLSAVIVARPYDEKDSGSTKSRALHEVEIMAAGAIGKNLSAFFEVEAEDETDFEPELARGMVTYNYNEAANLQFSYGAYLAADSYGFLGDSFRMTRGHVKAIDEKFGGADAAGKLRSNRQQVAVYGRPIEQLFYSVGYGGESADAEGEEAANIHGRIAYDITPDVMIGAFGISGKSNSTDRSFDRYGIDFQTDIENARIAGAWVTASDDTAVLSVEEKNDAFSLQAMYIFKNAEEEAQWVPLVRFDNYERADGVDDFSELTLNLTHYFSENMKGFVEYWQQLEVPTGIEEDNRLTLQFHVAF